MTLVYIIIGGVVGGVLGWLFDRVTKPSSRRQLPSILNPALEGDQTPVPGQGLSTESSSGQ